MKPMKLFLYTNQPKIIIENGYIVFDDQEFMISSNIDEFLPNIAFYGFCFVIRIVMRTQLLPCFLQIFILSNSQKKACYSLKFDQNMNNYYCCLPLVVYMRHPSVAFMLEPRNIGETDAHPWGRLSALPCLILAGLPPRISVGRTAYANCSIHALSRH